MMQLLPVGCLQPESGDSDMRQISDGRLFQVKGFSREEEKFYRVGSMWEEALLSLTPRLL